MIIGRSSAKMAICTLFNVFGKVWKYFAHSNVSAYKYHRMLVGAQQLDHISSASIGSIRFLLFSVVWWVWRIAVGNVPCCNKCNKVHFAKDCLHRVYIALTIILCYLIDTTPRFAFYVQDILLAMKYD